MPAGGAVIAGGAAIGGVGSYFGGKQQANAVENASDTQLQMSRESIAAQQELAQKAFDIFGSESDKARGFLTQQNNLARQDLAPLREMGLANLRMARSFASPNSDLSNQERAAFGKTLANTLSARGLTASGSEISGLSDFELGLAGQRRNIALGLAGQGAGAVDAFANLRNSLGQGLAGISQGVGQAGASLFGNLGQNIGSTLSQTGSNLGNLQIAQGQAQAQGLSGISNAFQTGLLGYSQYGMQQQALEQQQNQFNTIFGVK